jgi:hypothetical protein
VKRSLTALSGALALLAGATAFAQGGLTVPKTVQAGSAFSIESTGGGQATLYIVGPQQVMRREVQLGAAISIPEGMLYNAGRYTVFVSTAPNDVASLEVTPAKVSELNFLARPSRLAVGLHNGITGAVYVFDSYKNLVTEPTQISFSLTTPSGASASRTEQSKNGAAWIAMDSSAKEGAAHFVAKAADVSTTRIIGQVPGDPCSLRMTAKPSGKKITLETEPVKDCSGNAVPDGTIVTFTATYGGGQTTVDVPLKRGVAKVEMPAYPGANISVASGVVLGNQIHWGR